MRVRRLVRTTPKQVVEYEIEYLKRLIKNLLVDNVNLKSSDSKLAYYFELHPDSISFQYKVVEPTVEYILEKIDALGELLIDMAADED